MSKEDHLENLLHEKVDKREEDCDDNMEEEEEEEEVEESDLENGKIVNIATTIKSLAHAKKVWANKRYSLRLSKRAKYIRRFQWRVRFGNALDSTPAHVFLIILLVTDLVATGIHILKTLYDQSQDIYRCVGLLDACQCTSEFEITESWGFLRLFSISILFTMLFHVLGLLVSFGMSFFKHPGYLVDIFIIPIALTLEIFENEGAVLLTILNLWRIVMLAHGVIEVTEEALGKEIHNAQKQLKGLQHEGSIHGNDEDPREVVIILRKKIEELENQLLQTKPMPHSNSLPKSISMRRPNLHAANDDYSL